MSTILKTHYSTKLRLALGTIALLTGGIVAGCAATPTAAPTEPTAVVAEVAAVATTAAITTSARAFLGIHNSSILPASGFAVAAYVSSGWPTHTLDLTNNNWGVTDAAAIDALIWDHHDDPSNPCTVLYQPYVGQPVSIESTTWGGLKSLWR